MVQASGTLGPQGPQDLGPHQDQDTGTIGPPQAQGPQDLGLRQDPGTSGPPQDQQQEELGLPQRLPPRRSLRSRKEK